VSPASPSTSRVHLGCLVAITIAIAACGGGDRLASASLPHGSGGGATTTTTGAGGHGTGGHAAGGGSITTTSTASAASEACPMGASPGLPAASPRVLVLAPSALDPTSIATHLQGLLAGDAAFTSPVVEAATTDTSGGSSLMSSWYVPTGRADRVAALAKAHTWVVLVEDAAIAKDEPELFFEGVRVTSCAARAAGATPLLVQTWSSSASETATRGELAYRVGNGTGTAVVPVGFAWDGLAASVPARATLVAAAAVYEALTGRAAKSSSYAPEGLPAAKAQAISDGVSSTLAAHAAKSH
jgi:hypothetical protein